jgi:hypothetical protein
VILEDAGGAGTWTVSRVVRVSTPGARLALPATTTVPGTLDLEIAVSPGAAAGDIEGYVELQRGQDTRRVPFWGHVSAAALSRHRPLTLLRPGLVRGTTAGQKALVLRYRYPESPRGLGVTTILRGPERVYTIRIAKPVANFGVVVTGRPPGSGVEPRVVAGADENRLTGYAALPVVYNPYLDEFQELVPAAGALAPVPGEYSIVFDSATRAGSGRFTFRFWLNDVSPPSLRLRTPSVDAGEDLKVAASDAGAGVFPESIRAWVDGDRLSARFAPGVVSIPTRGLTRGDHRLRLRVSDYQEAKNTENVARILPNTRTLTVTFRVR